MPLTEPNRVWAPSPQYAKVVEANRQFYAKHARLYETGAVCVNDPQAQQQLEQTLEEVLDLLDRPAADVQVLDACGGTGNVALKLLKRGLNVTLTDISPEQLAIFEEKSGALRARACVVCGEIGSFLAEHSEQFDLIVFSASLHHIENYAAVLKLCLTALRPGGLVLTTHDPTNAPLQSFLTRLILFADYISYKVLVEASDLPAALGRRAKRMLSGAKRQKCEQMQIDSATVGVLAEYYAKRGINDRQLADELRAAGFDVVWHKRRTGARYGIWRRLLGWTGAKTEFDLLLRKPATAY